MSETVDYFKNRRNLINLLLFLILIVGIPVGIGLLKTQNILKSRADVVPVDFVVDDNCVVIRNNVKVARCANVAVQLISPLGPPVPISASAAANP
jgi:hypothetical protein